MKPPHIGWAEDELSGFSDPREWTDLIGAAARPALLAIGETMPRTRQPSEKQT